MSRTGSARVRCVVCIALLVLASACGGGDEKATPTPSGERGGTFKIVFNGDVDHIDPGQAYYNFSNLIFRVTSRTLVSYPAEPGSAGARLVADIATDTGQVSDGGLTYTFIIRDGVRYQPQAAGGREVRSEDFRYAIERGFKPSVANGYVNNYFEDVIVGDTEFADGKAAHIAGIDVGDPKRVVFHLRRPTGDFGFRLALFVASPVPEEYAGKYDSAAQSEYGPNFAATGPYMLERKGAKATGYQAGKRIVLVRNPNWDAATDPIRTAHPDRIEVTEGFSDASLAADKVLRGDFDLNGDIVIPPEKIQQIRSNPAVAPQLKLNPAPGLFYVGLNSTIRPFDNVKVRQAANVVMDKTAARLALGGEVAGDIATHVLLPGLLGFEEAGGKTYDPYASKDFAGDPSKAQALMREAGYPNGMYDGPPVLMVSGNDPADIRMADVVQASLAKIGIRVQRDAYEPNVMFTKYLLVPDAKVVVAPSAGWGADYPDHVTVVKALFDGRLITPSGNNNFSQLNDPELNSLIDRAVAAAGAERARLWAEADRRVMELAPVIPLRWAGVRDLVSKRVAGYQLSAAFGVADLAHISVRSGT